MWIIRYKNIFFTVSALAVVASLVSLLYFGWNVGIDFKGGSVLEAAYSEIGRASCRERV